MSRGERERHEATAATEKQPSATEATRRPGQTGHPGAAWSHGARHPKTQRAGISKPHDARGWRMRPRGARREGGVGRVRRQAKGTQFPCKLQQLNTPPGEALLYRVRQG